MVVVVVVNFDAVVLVVLAVVVIVAVVIFVDVVVVVMQGVQVVPMLLCLCGVMCSSVQFEWIFVGS